MKNETLREQPDDISRLKFDDEVRRIDMTANVIVILFLVAIILVLTVC